MDLELQAKPRVINRFEPVPRTHCVLRAVQNIGQTQRSAFGAKNLTERRTRSAFIAKIWRMFCVQSKNLQTTNLSNVCFLFQLNYTHPDYTLIIRLIHTHHQNGCFIFWPVIFCKQKPYTGTVSPKQNFFVQKANFFCRLGVSEYSPDRCTDTQILMVSMIQSLPWPEVS